jgi:DNA mismatch repair ATPase MutL
MYFSRLVIKQSLELTSTNEDILIENIETFRANGFEFEIHRDSTPTQRVFLTQIPHSKNWIFGKQVSISPTFYAQLLRLLILKV